MPQNFSHQLFKGQSFKGQNLSGADFSYTDIRGVNFKNAILTGANFHQAKAGQPYRWVLSLMAGSLLLVTLGGLISAYAGGLVAHLVFRSGKPEFFFSSLIFLLVLAGFIFITVRRGLGAALGGFAVVITATIAVLAASGKAEAVVATIIQAVAIASAIAGTLLNTLGTVTVWLIAGNWVLLLAVFAALLGSVFGASEGVELGELIEASRLAALGLAGAISLVLLGLSSFISWRVIAGDSKYRLISALATMLSSIGGTNFRGANLTDADFTQAILKGADLRQAILTRTCWLEVRKLDQARIEGTYLENRAVQRLAVTKEGQGGTWDRLDLRGLNLKDANLEDASFIGADLSESTLENANLQGAKLVQTQLYRTDLTGARLTGAYIQNWGISVDTKLEAVKCKHIYMQLPTKNDPDPCRKPDDRNESFKEGDFADFIAPIIKTLDLYRTQNVDLRQMASTFKTLDLFHYKGIDPAAAAVAIQQLAEDHPEAELEVVALEGRGNEKIRLQAVVTGDANRSELSAEYFEKYRQIKSLPYSDLQALFAGVVEKNERIRSLESLLENALQQPKFYVETYQNQGEFVMTQSKGNVNISGVQGNVSGVAAAGESQTMTGVAIGAISGSVTNTISQLPASSDSNNPGIKELLTQLQAAIESEAELPDEDKVEALEQVQALAEAGQKPEDNILQKSAKTAMKILKGTVSSLPDAAKLADACAKLLPIISKLLLLA